MLKKIGQFGVFLLLLLGPTGHTKEACGDSEKKTAIYQAFENCESARAAKSASEIDLYLKKMSANGYCTTLAIHDGAELSSQLCQDPSGFACGEARGNLFNSHCEFWPADTRDANNTPTYVTDKCRFEAQEDIFLGNHASECLGQGTKLECDATVKLNHQKELAQAERDIVYSPERVSRVQKIFRRVMETYLQAVTDSKLIPESKKALVLAQLRATVLEVPPSKDNPPACTNSEPTGPDSGIYNEGGKVIFCIGAIALLDHVNEYDLMHTLAHEISHSIDPCNLEYIQNSIGEGAPLLGRETYPGLLQCLRGGNGPSGSGCENSILHCNTSQGIRDAVSERMEDAKDLPKDMQALTRKNLIEGYQQTPDCPIGKTDKADDSNNLTDFRHDAQPVDQIPEAFADFMGAEIVGRIAEQDARSGSMDKAEKEDALETIASDYSRLHGGCRNENTHDPHPPGFLRVNRVIMGSKVFRESMGCSVKPPSTVGASKTCQGL